jgi:hypothetical protein
MLIIWTFCCPLTRALMLIRMFLAKIPLEEKKEEEKDNTGE